MTKVKQHILDHSVVLALASLNIPSIYLWVSGQGIHNLFAGMTAIAIDLAMYRCATDKVQTRFSQWLVMVSALGLTAIQVYLYGAAEGLMHSIPIAIAYLFLKHVQYKGMQEPIEPFEGTYQDTSKNNQGTPELIEGDEGIESNLLGDTSEPLEIPAYTCTHCGKTFKTAKGLQTHLGMVHSIKE